MFTLAHTFAPTYSLRFFFLSIPLLSFILYSFLFFLLTSLIFNLYYLILILPFNFVFSARVDCRGFFLRF